MDSATRDQYKTAKEAVEKVKNTDLSAQLNEQLKQVDKMLTDKEKKKKRKRKSRRSEKQLKNKQTSRSSSSCSSPLNKLRSHKQHSKKRHPRPSSSNSANQPIKSARASDIADASNPAWTWAPGVQSKVIATCIQRGYIVEGGYRLEKPESKMGRLL